MTQDRTKANGVCRHCRSTHAVAAAEARAIGSLNEFISGKYTCCQVVQWANEQRLAWEEAAFGDGNPAEGAASRLQLEPDSLLVLARVRKPKL